MNKSFIQIATVIFISIFLNVSAYSSNEYFRSVTSGNWNLNSTWEMSLNSGGSWIPANSTPQDSSGVITVRSPHIVSVTVNVSANEIVVNTGGTISIGNGIVLTITDGNLTDLNVSTGGAVSGQGTVRSQGAGTLLLVSNSSNFSAALNVFSGTTTSYDPSGPFTALFKGNITIDAGAVLTSAPSGYSIQANGNVINNGAISGNSLFRMRGSSFINNGTVSMNDFNFDTTTTVSGTPAFTCANITINGSGNVSFSGNVTFSPVSNFNINSGGILNPAGLTLTSGTMNLLSGGTLANTGTLKTTGSPVLNIKAGSNFNGQLNVVSGTTTAYDASSPLTAIIKGNITVNSGATLTSFAGGYSVQANGNVTNNGSISGNSIFKMRGSTFINNGTVSINDFNFDSITTVSGTTAFTGANITINGSGNVSYTGNVTFSPVSNFNINSGGILNPTGLTLTSGFMNLLPGGTVAISGTLKTSGSPVLNIKAGSNFNGQLNVVSGTTTAYDASSPLTAIIKGNITVNSGATLTSFAGGYSVQANGNVTNNGLISGNSIFKMRGSSFINNGIVSINDFNFDSATTVSGTPAFTGANISINGSGNVSFTGSVTFSPTQNFKIFSGGILNPAGLTYTSGTMYLYSGGTVANTGTLKTSGSPLLIIKAGSNFNAQLNVISGNTTARDDASPLTANFNGTILIDSGAVLSGIPGGYSIQANGNVTNNGSIDGNSIFKFNGSVFTNNGSVRNTAFNFVTGAQTLQGTGTWTSAVNILTGSVTTLGSNHKLMSLNVNAGGTFSLSTFKLSVSASNPITNNGTFTSSNGIVEYNGTSSQSISTTNISYSRLRINNVSGTYLPAPITVSDTLSVLTGTLNLNGFILTISPSGYLTETGGNTVTGTSGYITTTRTINAPSALNAGGLGAVLTSAANLGVTEIRRGHTVQNGLNGNTSILRYFDILPANNSGLNATLVFNYDQSELNGKTEGALTLFRSTNTGSTWTPRGGTVNTAANTITLGSIDAFSRWSSSSVASIAAQINVIVEGYYDIASNKLSKRDTVRAYLRNVTSPYAAVDSALSVIDSTVFSGNFNFINAVSGTYYIQVKQRNSIETWSKTGGQSYVLGSAMMYDFTTSPAQAYGNNLAHKGTKYCIFSGDINQDGTVDAGDLSKVENDADVSLSGYVSSDVNGDDFVDAGDVSIVENNVALGVNAITP